MNKIGTTEWDNSDIINSLDGFLELYKTRPIITNTGGGLSVNLFDSYFVMSQIKPKYIIESGVFQGQGTWLIEKTLPNTSIVSIDPLPQQRIYNSPNSTYITKDFLTFTNDNISKDRAAETMIYFDDHQDQYTRLLHAYKLGFKHILLDDNHPEYRGLRHLTLAACLDDKSDDGFVIPENAADNLLEIMDVYSVCPPIFRWTDSITMEGSVIEETPLFESVDKRYETFYNDMHNYRWSTYVRLK
jgi:hypothetical protein